MGTHRIFSKMSTHFARFGKKDIRSKRRELRAIALLIISLGTIYLMTLGILNLVFRRSWTVYHHLYDILTVIMTVIFCFFAVDLAAGIIFKFIYREYFDEFEVWFQKTFIQVACFGFGFHPLINFLRSIVFSHLQMIIFFFSKFYSIFHTLYNLNQVYDRVKHIEWDIPNTQLFSFFRRTRTCEAFLESFLEYWHSNYETPKLPNFPFELMLLMVPLYLWCSTLIFITGVHFLRVQVFGYQNDKKYPTIEWKESFQEIWRFFTEVESFGIIFLPMLFVEFLFWLVNCIYPYPGFQRIRSVEYVYNMAITIEVFLAACLNLSPALAWLGFRPHYISFFLTPLGGMPGYNELQGALGRSLLSCLRMWYDGVKYVSRQLIYPLTFDQTTQVLNRELGKKHRKWETELSVLITDFILEQP